MMPLTMAKVGEPVTIRKITGKDEVRQHLAELGFVVDAAVTVMNDMGGNLIIKVKESRIALDKAMAKLSERASRTIAVRSNGRIISLSTAHIHYVESDRRLARLHTAHGTVETYMPLSQILPQLGMAFVQCHKSFLVNMAQVAQMDSDWMHLKNGSRTPVSQAYRKRTREAYMDYLARLL